MDYLLNIFINIIIILYVNLIKIILYDQKNEIKSYANLTNREKASPIDGYLVICEDLKDSNRVYLDIYLLLMEILLLTNNGSIQ